MFGRLFGTNSNPSNVSKYTSNAGILLNNHAIDVKIIERYAKISYLFDFENTNEYGSKELKFEITISPNAFISGFTADIDGELFYGETKEKKQAKQEYIAAKQKDENAILISQIDKNIPNLFKIQTNIDAESEISLTIKIEQYLKKKFNFAELNIEILRDFDKYNITRNYEHIAFDLKIIDQRGIYDITLPSQSGDTKSSNDKLSISAQSNNILQIDENTMDKSNECYTMKGKLMYKQSRVTEFMLKYKIKGEQNDHSILYDSQSKTFCHIISDIITDSLITDTDLTEGNNDEIKENILIPRRVVFLIDRSYSMHGDKWQKTKSATIIALNYLRINYDRFCIIFFDQNIREFPHNSMLLANNESVKNAISYVANMGLGGATDINKPLLQAIDLIKSDIRYLNGDKKIEIKYNIHNNNNDEADEDAELMELQKMLNDDYEENIVIKQQKITNDKNVSITNDKNVSLTDNYNFYMNQIILISDGEPNNGVRNTNAILKNVQQANKLDDIDKYSNKISLHTFGVGSSGNDSQWTKDLNHSFLKLLALNNNGMYKRIKTINCDTQLNDYYNILSKPILTNINIQYNTNNIKNITNTKFNTLFHGNDMIICGQLMDDKQLNIKVTITAITGKEIMKENNTFATKPIHINKEIEIVIPRKDTYENKENTYNEGDQKNENNIERMWAYFKLQQFAKQKLIYNDMIEIDENEQKHDDALPFELAMKYKFVTPWTSMIVVKSKEGNPKKKKKKKKKRKKKPAPKLQLNDNIKQLRNVATQLEKREVHLDKKIQQCLNNAKAKSKRRDKKGALWELKKKKHLEGQLSSIQGKKLDMERQIMELEDAHLNKETLKSMKTSANAMKATVKESDLDKADELMEDINEAMDQVNEMNEAMHEPLGQVMNDDELEDELAELEELEADELLNDMILPSASAQYNMNNDNMDFDLPSVPTQAIHIQDDDDELAELDAMMGDTIPAERFTGRRESRTMDHPANAEEATAKRLERASKQNNESVKPPDIFGDPFGDEDSDEEEIRKIIEAYNDDNIRITFECIKSSKDPNICRVLATFYNKSLVDMESFSFEVNVPQYIKLQMQSANGTKLLKQSKNTITQRFELDNKKYGNKAFAVDFKITFTSNSKEKTIKSSVQISV